MFNSKQYIQYTAVFGTLLISTSVQAGGVTCTGTTGTTGTSIDCKADTPGTLAHHIATTDTIVTLDDSTIKVEESGKDGISLSYNQTTKADIAIHANQFEEIKVTSISTSFDRRQSGLFASIGNSDEGKVSVLSKGESIIIEGEKGIGIEVRHDGSKGLAVAEQDGGKIVTTGKNSYGVYVKASAEGVFLPFITGGGPLPKDIITQASFKQVDGEIISDGEQSGAVFVSTSTYSAGNASFEQHNSALAKTTGGENTTVEVEAGVLGTATLKQFDNAKIVRDSNGIFYAAKVTGGNTLFEQAKDSAITTRSEKSTALQMSANGGGDNKLVVNGLLSSDKGDVIVLENNNQDIQNNQVIGKSVVSLSNTARLISNVDKNVVKRFQSKYDQLSSPSEMPYGFAIRQFCGISCDVKKGLVPSIPGVKLNELGADSEITMEKDTQIKGAIALSDGDDVLTLNGTDIRNIHFMDGGDDSQKDDTFIDTVNFNEITAQYQGDDLTNWEIVNLKNNTTLTLTNNLATGKGQAKFKGTGPDVNLGLNIDASSQLKPSSNALTVDGDVNNNGTIDLRQSNQFMAFKVNGDYNGNHGKVIFNAELVDNTTKFDNLEITGKVGGHTTVSVNKVNTVNVPTKADTVGIRLVTLHTGHGAQSNTFTLDKPVESGAYEYNVLALNNKLGEEGFYLRSSAKIIPPPSTPTVPTTPKPAIVPITPKPPIDGGNNVPPLYRSVVSGYRMSQFVNHEAVADMVDSLHRRIGEEYFSIPEKSEKQQVWGRIRANAQSLTGRQQFDANNKTTLLQFGWDFTIDREKENNPRHTGVYLGVSQSKSKFYDRMRRLAGRDTYTGKLKSGIYSAGIYHSRFDEKGDYVDFVGGLHYIDNKYHNISGKTVGQKGVGVSASVEGGLHYASDNGWFIEPQAQLSWQLNKYSAFDDTVAHIDSYRNQSLRSRIGARGGFIDTDDHGKNAYLTADILHEWMSPTDVTVGGTKISENLGKTWFELGVAGQFPVADDTVIYGKASYQHAIGNDSRHGAQGQFGIRHSW